MSNLIDELNKNLNLNDSSNNILRETIQINFNEGLTILILSILVGYVLRLIYKKFATTFSSPENYGNTLLIVTLSVACLIAVVKSSLALSLGLVGALSVIRFRTAVKEPYTLSFILLSVCMGISIGASQYKFALLILIASFICTYLISNPKIFGRFKNKANSEVETLSITTENSEILFNVLNLLSKYCYSYNLNNISEVKDSECCATISVKLKSFNKLKELTTLITNFEGVKIINFYNTPY